MTLILSSKQHGQLLDWAEKAGNKECCGLLLGQGGAVSETVLSANVAADPSRHFEIDPVVLIAAEKQARQDGPSILGYFHSHPDGSARPSAQDAASAVDDGRVWLIIANGSISGWVPTTDDTRAIRFEHAELLVEA